jgi:hypothetical protein
MKKEAPRVPRKIYQEKSDKPKKRKKIKKKKTKADLKKEFHHSLQEALRHIEIFNRIVMGSEKIDHLNRAAVLLDKCLDLRPGNHILRKQVKICREELNTVKEAPAGSNSSSIDILISKEF